MQIQAKTIGLLRFSVLTPTYYSERFATLEETAAHIFSSARMELRFHLFERLCLPSLTRQSDGDFDMVVLTAETMPEPWIGRLHSLLDPLPNIHLRRVGTGNHYRLLQDGYASIPTDGQSHRILFRLDDDDALDLGFVARTKRLAAGLMQLQDPQTPFVIAHNRGFYVRRAPGGNEVFDACERAPLSAGTTLVAPVGHGPNPYRFVHRKLAQHYNTFSDISVPGFIRTIHGDNKSNPTQMGITHKLKDDEIDRDLHDHFGIGLAMLRTL
ncbi:MAG: glycosyltransferase [Jhaorihella sp.]